MTKASGGDGIPVELFQILKDGAVQVLHSICQKMWKTQQWPQDWKMSVFIPIPKKGNAKECSNYCTIALISHVSKVVLKILQARLQQYVNRELPHVQAGFRKGSGTRDQIANVCWIMEKAREFQMWLNNRTRMSYTWNHTVWSLFRWTSLTLCTWGSSTSFLDLMAHFFLLLNDTHHLDGPQFIHSPTKEILAASKFEHLQIKLRSTTVCRFSH